MKKKCFAAIDLGTNSCRLLVADVNGKTLERDITSVKLGKGMYKHMCFVNESMERTLDNFKKIKSILDNYEILRHRYVATAACRMASNGAEFLALVKKETGIELEVINGEEEAYLSLKGAVFHVKGESEYVVSFDIGGGSTELTLAENVPNLKVIKTVSIPWGARNASEAFKMSDYDEEKASKLKADVMTYIVEFMRGLDFEKYRKDIICIAMSSAALRVAALVKNTGIYDRDILDGTRLKLKDIDKNIQNVYKLNFDERANSPYIGHRADIFVAGCVIYKTIVDVLGVENIVSSLRSAKDGIIDELIEKHNGKTN